MRKYDIKNKRNIGIIIGISIIIIIMFSLVIKLFLSSDKKEYTVHDGALVFDKDKSIIKVTEDSTIKKKWNNEYYLKFKDNNYELGNTAISYNEKTGEIILYGKYYEIGSGDLIDVTDGETVIKSSVITKFYKLADRKYLVVDKDIKTSDGLLSTNEFLMIDLDKVGNATLVNHKVNLKAFAATFIVTSNYTFDIANEILTYGSNKIDLKKIIGSSNTYTKEDLIPEENDNSSSNDGVTNITDNTNGSGSGNGGGTGGTTGGNGTTGDNKGTGDGKNNNSGNVIEEIKKATKRTSVISVTSSVSKIVVDYVVYDPYNEYTNVYMEVEEAGSNKINTIYLNKNDTRYEFTNIFPNTNYRIKFKYSYIEDGNEVIDTFDDITIATKRPKVNIKTTNVSFGKISYLITTDNSYNIESGTLTVKVNNEVVSSNSVSINGNTTDSVSISASSGDMVELILSDIKAGGRIISGVRSSDKFIY